MKQEINIFDGKGVIHLKGGPSETFLYVKKELKLISFFAEVGTVWRYHIGRELNKNLITENYNYEELVNSGMINKSKELSIQFKHILQLLTNGNYELHYCEFSWDMNILPAIKKDNKKSAYDVYGGMADIIATQTYEDTQTIDKYKKDIKNGVRPISVLIKLKDSWSIYILDGHHKLKAYQEMKVNPKTLVISKLDNKSIEVNKAINDMKKLGMDNKEWIDIYKDEKSTKAQEHNFNNYYSEGLKNYFK